MSRIVVWFSCGAASAVAAKLSIKAHGRENVTLCYCETGAEHEDNERFLHDIEQWLGVFVIRIRSEKYSDTWDVWEKRNYLAGIHGAPCTLELKVVPRLAFQRPDDTHVFGYTDDTRDRNRAVALRENYPELSIETPLIENSLSKASCLHLIESAGIGVPVLYGMGYPNNNCIPCVKATSIAYWALVRQTFPEEFARMVDLSRRKNVKLTRLNGKRIFIDEIPADQPVTDAIAPSCDFLCSIIEQEMDAEKAP